MCLNPLPALLFDAKISKISLTYKTEFLIVRPCRSDVLAKRGIEGGLLNEKKVLREKIFFALR